MDMILKRNLIISRTKTALLLLDEATSALEPTMQVRLQCKLKQKETCKLYTKQNNEWSEKLLVMFQNSKQC